MTTPGWKTTEFWITALTVLSILVGWLAGWIPAEYAALAQAISAGIYAAARSYAKGKQIDETLRNQVLGVLGAVGKLPAGVNGNGGVSAYLHPGKPGGQTGAG